MVYDFLEMGLINDGTFKCCECEEVMQCFTSQGETSFCPMCGQRNWAFEELNIPKQKKKSSNNVECRKSLKRESGK